jgi:hypothetical protein
MLSGSPADDYWDRGRTPGEIVRPFARASGAESSRACATIHEASNDDIATSRRLTPALLDRAR